LRVQGLASAAKRADREAGEGAVAVVRNGNVAAIVEMRCETDFVAKSDDFVSLVDEIAARVCAEGEGATSQFQENIEVMLTTLKENISLGRVYRLEAGEGEVVDTYIHQQAGRGVNAVAVVVKGGAEELAHEIAVHIAFAKPLFLKREDVPAEEVAAERKTVEEISRNEGKPEAALPKIIEGRLNGWFKERVLLEQPYVKDEKQSVQQFLNGASITAFAQVVIGS
jgi:elongation factor Ts